MYCTNFSGDGGRELHIGDGAKDDRFIDRLLEELPQVESIQADGHELEAIRKMFTGPLGISTIPFPDMRVCRWWGDIARTIHANMISYKGFGM